MSEFRALSVEEVEELKLSAQSFGFENAWVADVLEKWGDDVLSLTVEAARNGFSVSFVMDVLNRFGPSVLELLFDLWNRKTMAANMAFVEGERVNPVVIEGMDSTLLQLLLEKFLPVIIDKYGDQILKLFMDAILKVLTNK